MDQKAQNISKKAFYILDGLNICKWQRHKTSLRILLTLLVELKKKKAEFICFFDANTRFRLNNSDRKVYEELLEMLPDAFHEVTGGLRADDILLLKASSASNYVVSNDRYQDYKDQYLWLRSNPERLIKGSVVVGDLLVPHLGISATIDEDVVVLLRKLTSVDSNISTTKETRVEKNLDEKQPDKKEQKVSNTENTQTTNSNIKIVQTINSNIKQYRIDSKQKRDKAVKENSLNTSTVKEINDLTNREKSSSLLNENLNSRISKARVKEHLPKIQIELDPLEKLEILYWDFQDTLFFLQLRKKTIQWLVHEVLTYWLLIISSAILFTYAALFIRFYIIPTSFVLYFDTGPLISILLIFLFSPTLGAIAFLLILGRAFFEVRYNLILRYLVIFSLLVGIGIGLLFFSYSYVPLIACILAVVGGIIGIFIGKLQDPLTNYALRKLNQRIAVKRLQEKASDNV